MNPVLIKFLDTVIDYLTKGIVPNIYCKNINLMEELFISLHMDQQYLNYLINGFENKKSKFNLRLLKPNEISNFNKRVKGPVEYFCLLGHLEHIYFYIGPYDYPIRIIN